MVRCDREYETGWYGRCVRKYWYESGAVVVVVLNWLWTCDCRSDAHAFA